MMAICNWQWRWQPVIELFDEFGTWIMDSALANKLIYI